MNYLRTEQDVEQLIEEMKTRTKGDYITQGVSFNKNSPRQMELLKWVLLESPSFSGFVKELLGKTMVIAMTQPRNDTRYTPTGYTPIHETVGTTGEVAYLQPTVVNLNPTVASLNPKVENLNPQVENLNPKVANLQPKVTEQPNTNTPLVNPSPSSSNMNLKNDLSGEDDFC